jgi:hypothetical protein
MSVEVQEAKELICELCRLFYDQGWVGGTGGGISVKAGDRIVMAPSGVQKERMLPTDMYVLDSEGSVVEEPKARPAPYKPPKLSECSPLFMAVSGAEPSGAASAQEATLRSLAWPPRAAGWRAVRRCRQPLAGRGGWRPAGAGAGAAAPPRPPPLAPSAQAYELRGAGAVMHSHSMNSVLATMLDPSSSEFRITHIEMIKVRRAL